jgi:hypothetical protein
VTVNEAGTELTVTGSIAKQPLLSVYDIEAVPSAIPHTMPLAEPAVAIDGLLLLQFPPGTASVYVRQLPTHSEATPEIADGAGLTVIIFVAEQLLLCV